MKHLIKKLQHSIIIILVITFILTLTPTIYCSESDAPITALSFMNEVLQLDVQQYNAKLERYSVDYPNKLEGIAQEGFTYILESGDSKLDVFFRFTDGTLTYCLLTVEKGEPIYTQHSENVLDETPKLLDRYQSWTGDSSLQEMKDIWSTIDASENVITTLNNMKLEVLWRGDFPSFYWKETLNGADYTTMGFGFDDGKFVFGDTRSIYQIGNTSISTSREDAIASALKYLENYSYTVNMGSDHSIEVTDFNIVEENITAKLLTRPKGYLTLYPYWNIKLDLDRDYPGFVSSINVGIWADNGELIFCKPVGWGGSTPIEAPSTEFRQENNSIYTITNLLIAFSVVTIVVIVLVLIKKKHK